MESTALNKIKDFEFWDFENLYFKEIIRSEYINSSIDRYDVGVKTLLIQKNRPKGSKEILLPFQGKLRVHTEKGFQDFDPEENGLSLIFINPNEKRQFENIGEKPVKVLAIFAPQFQMNEIEHLMKK